MTYVLDPKAYAAMLASSFNAGLEVRAKAMNARNVTEEIAPLGAYVLQLFGPDGEARGIGPQLLRETEENLTDLLPPGYRVEIKEWDE